MTISDKGQRGINREVLVEDIFLKLPVPALLIAGFVLFVSGMLLVVLIWAPFNLWESGLGIHPMMAGFFFAFAGLLLTALGLAIRIDSVHRGQLNYDKITEFILGHVTYERGATAGLVIFLIGLVYTFHLLWIWFGSGHNILLTYEQGFAGFSLITIGLQTIICSIYLSVISEEG